MLTLRERVLLSLIPLLFFLLFCLIIYNVGYKTDKRIKLEGKHVDTIQLKRPFKFLYGIYESKKGRVTKKVFVFSTVGWVLNGLYIFSVGFFLFCERFSAYFLIIAVVLLILTLLYFFVSAIILGK